MSLQTSIAFSGVGRSEPVEQMALARVRLLAERFPEVFAWRIAIEASKPSLGACHVRMTIAKAEGVLMIVQNPHEDASGSGVFKVLDRAFSAAAARLERMRPDSFSPATVFSHRAGSAA
jgi:hypothetical protein